jgi:peptide/nickel transport system substrate-binding protein
VAVPSFGERFEQVLTQRAREAGIDLRIETKAGPQWLEAAQSGSVDMALGGWLCDCPDAHGMIYPLLHTQVGLHAAMVGTAEVDRLIERAQWEQDPETRRRIYREIEANVRDRALLLPLYHRQTTVVTAEEITDVELNLFPPYVSWEKLRFRRYGE